MVFTEEHRKRMTKIAPAQMGHYVTSGYMHPSIKPVFSAAKAIGPAVTVRITGNDNAVLYYAMEHSAAGSVIVIDRGGEMMRACCGEGVSLVAQMHGLTGIVIDGMATDSVGIERLAFPVFSRGISALTTSIHGTDGELNVPIQCGGTVVNAGDIIFGDADGVLAIPPEDLERLLSAAEKADENEINMFRSFHAKEKTMSDYYPIIHKMADRV